MPYSILEAMASSAAVVATDIPAHREIDGSSGAMSLVTANAEALAVAAARLIADRDLADAQRRAAREVVEANHSLAGFTAAMGDIYRSIAMGGVRGAAPYSIEDAA